MRPKPNVVVGIDNGISGGLCAISGHDGSYIESIPMPVSEDDGKTEVRISGVLAWLEPFRHSLAVCIEEPLKHAKSSQAMRSMSISFGKILGACEAKNYSIYRIQVKEWQDVELGKKLPKGQTKVIALSKAQTHWPKEGWLATLRSRVPHDGMVDAALIARFFQQHRL